MSAKEEIGLIHCCVYSETANSTQTIG